MAVGEFPFPAMPTLAGIRLSTASAGIKRAGRKDLVLMELAEGSTVAGVFTRNAFCAAPVTLCRQHLSQADIRYLLINSGNANACTGEQGMRDALACCAAVAGETGCRVESVLPFSTSVIGETLQVDKIIVDISFADNTLTVNCWMRLDIGHSTLS